MSQQVPSIDASHDSLCSHRSRSLILCCGASCGRATTTILDRAFNYQPCTLTNITMKTHILGPKDEKVDLSEECPSDTAIFIHPVLGCHQIASILRHCYLPVVGSLLVAQIRISHLVVVAVVVIIHSRICHLSVVQG